MNADEASQVFDTGVFGFPLPERTTTRAAIPPQGPVPSASETYTIQSDIAGGCPSWLVKLFNDSGEGRERAGTERRIHMLLSWELFEENPHDA